MEKEMATHSSVLAWRIPWTEKPGGLQSMGWQQSDMIQRLNHHHQELVKGIPKWRRSKESACQCRKHGLDPCVGRCLREGNGIFLPGKSHRQRSLVGYSPWGHRVRHILGHIPGACEPRALPLSYFSQLHFLKGISVLIILFPLLHLPVSSALPPPHIPATQDPVTGFWYPLGQAHRHSARHSTASGSFHG